MLTLIINTDAVTLIKHNSGEVRTGGRFGLHIPNPSLVPAFAISVAQLLDDVVGVMVVHTNLPNTRPLGCIQEIQKFTRLFPVIIGDGS